MSKLELHDGTTIDLNETYNGTRNGGTFDHTHYKRNVDGWFECFDVCKCDQCGGIAIEPNTVKMDRPMLGSIQWPTHLPIPEMISWSDYYEDAVCMRCYYKGLELEEAEEAKTEWELLREFVERMDNCAPSGPAYRTVLNYMDTLERQR